MTFVAYQKSCVVFENCILSRYSVFLVTFDNQFGFKKTLGCAHAIYTVRRVADIFISSGSTVNLCAIDVSKAFDRMLSNPFEKNGLFIKLMPRSLPSILLSVFVD